MQWHCLLASVSDFFGLAVSDLSGAACDWGHHSDIVPGVPNPVLYAGVVAAVVAGAAVTPGSAGLRFATAAIRRL